MTTIMYDHLDEYEEPIPQRASQAIREAVLSIHESLCEAQEQERRMSAARNRIITFRMPIPGGHPNSPTHGHLKFPHPDRASMRR